VSNGVRATLIFQFTQHVDGKVAARGAEASPEAAGSDRGAGDSLGPGTNAARRFQHMRFC
jgi:hypothetical protein